MGRTNNKIAAMQIAGFKSIVFQVLLLNDTTRSTYTFTVDSATDVVTATGHNYVDGTQVTVSTAGTLPAPLVAATNYYVRDAAANTFKLALTRGGTAIDITTAGNGTFTVSDAALDATMATAAYPSPAVYVRKELTNYQGLIVRPTLTFTLDPTDFVDTFNYIRMLRSIILDNTAGGGDLVFDCVVLVEGGSTAIGDTTGTCADFTRLFSTKTILAGQPDTLQSQVLSRTNI